MTDARPVLFVSGGSRGLGRAIVLMGANRGWNVAFTYLRDDAAAREVCDAAHPDAKCVALKADMTNREAVRGAFADAHRQLGRLDALVNNAGVIGEPRAIVDVDEAHLDAVFRANVYGVFFACAEGVRLMSTDHGGAGGTIVNMSSAAARHGGLHQEAHYASSKGAIDSLTYALAKELPEQGIRVNAVRPGVIRTAIHDIHGGDAMIRRAVPTIPLKRAGEADEVAEAVLFLCGRASSYVNGVVLDVSGGR